jgi:predicted N-acetyltransferase YhbS
LLREEVPAVWGMDRAEVIERVYHLTDGRLNLVSEHYDMHGWPPGEGEKYTPLLLDCYDRGGVFVGAFDGTTLAGVMILESKFIGRAGDMLQLKFLHVSRAHRDRGLGTALFRAAARLARARGAQRLYISATPSEHTINFYLGQGCVVTAEPDPELWALEPEDIHLEYQL